MDPKEWQHQYTPTRSSDQYIAAHSSGQYTPTPGSESVPTEGPPPEYTDNDAAQLLHGFPPPPVGVTLQPLPVPVCLPQIVSGYDAPFARAYNSGLSASGIEQADWLKFLDGLNIAIAASPPLRVVDMAGMAIGFVPYHWAIIAGALMQTAAQTAMHILSKTLTDRYLRLANSNYFEPRGLKVRLMKTAAMRKFIHLDSDTGPPNKFKAFAKAAGHGVESVALRLPIPFLGRIYSMIPGAAPRVDPNDPSDITYRRLAQLQGFALPVSTEVPPPLSPDSLLDKASALAIKLRQSKARKSGAKANRRRQMLAVAEGRITSTEMRDMSDPSDRKAHKQARKAARRERKGRNPARHSAKLRGSVAKADRLEFISTGGLVWVVLMNADQDNEIAGKEIVDSAADVEEIDAEEWEDEIELENEEEEEEIKYSQDAKATGSYSE